MTLHMLLSVLLPCGSTECIAVRRYVCACAHQAYGSGKVNLNHSSNTGGCLGSNNRSKFSRFTECESDKSVTDKSHICKV
jgi:hypothetical protein